MSKIMEDMRNETIRATVAKPFFELVHDGLLAIEEAAKRMNMDVSTFKAEMTNYYSQQ